MFPAVIIIPCLSDSHALSENDDNHTKPRFVVKQEANCVLRRISPFSLRLWREGS